jgi:hypothetical protein
MTAKFFEKKFYQKLLLMLLVLISVSVISVHASNWKYLPDYASAYNISVNNWSYSSTYGGKLYFGQKSNFVIFNISNITGSLTVLDIEGYDRSLNNIGRIPYYILNYYGANAIVMIPNTTLSGNRWNKATIFYNPVDPFIVNQTIIDSSCILGFCSLNYNGVNVQILPNNLTTNLKVASSSPIYNGSFQEVNFSLNTSTSGAFVVIVNKTLSLKAIFNAIWYPDIFNGYDEFSNTGNYVLKTTGVPSSSVSNTAVSNKNSNYLFLNATDGLGYVGYFAEFGNQIISEGMTVNQSQSKISNFSTSKLTGITYFPIQQFFDLKIGSNPANAVQVDILPAYTTNTLITKVANNNNIVSGINSTLQGWYSDFIYREPFFDVNWTYNMTTYANPASNGLAYKIIQGPNEVPYLVLSILHYSNLGNLCQYTYFRNYNNNTKIDLGAIPFQVLNCSQTNTTARFLLANFSHIGNAFFSYNSFYMYFDSQHNNSPDFSNSTLLNKWNFYTGSNTIISNNVPFEINLNIPLDFNSVVKAQFKSGTFTSHIDIGYNGIEHIRLYGVTLGSGCNFGTALIANRNDSTGFLPLRFLISIVNGEFSIITRNLFGKNNIEPSTSTATLFNITSNVISGYCLTSSNSTNITLDGNNMATVYKLYTTQFRKGFIEQRTGNISACSAFNFCLPTIVIPVSNKSSSPSYTNTTTINIALIDTPLMIANGVNTDLATVVLIDFISLMVAVILMQSNESISYMIIAVVVIVDWILGLFTGIFGLIPIGFIIVMIFAIYYFVERRHHE